MHPSIAVEVAPGEVDVEQRVALEDEVIAVSAFVYQFRSFAGQQCVGIYCYKNTVLVVAVRKITAVCEIDTNGLTAPVVAGSFDAA